MKKPIKLIQEADKPKTLSIDNLSSSKLATMGYLYLQNRGWFNDIPLGDHGYTPWFTYPAVDFFRDILQRDMKVFEYGSGYGTIFLKNNVNEYASVEHDAGWMGHLNKIESNVNVSVVPKNAPVIPWVKDDIEEFKILSWDKPITGNEDHDTMHGLLNLDFHGYASEIGVKPKQHYDIIIVDGMARLLTGYLASKYIKETGVIILDNSDRWHYNSLQKYLISQGYGRIDFWGPGPGRQDAWCTSFFSKKFGITNVNPERPKGSVSIFA